MQCSTCHIECRYIGTAKGPINDIGLYSQNYECPKCKEITWALIPDVPLKVKNKRFK